MRKEENHRIQQHPDVFSGMTTLSTASVFALNINSRLTMASVFVALSLTVMVKDSDFRGDSSSKFNSVEAKSSECIGLSIDKDSSETKIFKA